MEPDANPGVQETSSAKSHRCFYVADVARGQTCLSCCSCEAGLSCQACSHKVTVICAAMVTVSHVTNHMSKVELAASASDRDNSAKRQHCFHIAVVCATGHTCPASRSCDASHSRQACSHREAVSYVMAGNMPHVGQLAY